MKTFQDLVAVKEHGTETDIMKFCLDVIDDHKSSQAYSEALAAEEYDKQRNVTINQYQKLLYTMSGKAVADNFSANWKCASNFFHRFVVQQTQYLLGNGIAFEDETIKEKIGGDRFDRVLKDIGRGSLLAGVCFGFYNMDHVEMFPFLQFAPLYDEEDGLLKAGVRHWQIADDKPLRFTLYEVDGFTEYIKPDGKEPRVYKEKRSYVLKVAVSDAGEEEVLSGRNYSTFPIVPCYGNNRQSMLVGMRQNIDCYDLIKSGFANDVDDASTIYWTLQNAGGMTDLDLAQFVERMKTVKAAVVSEQNGAQAEAHTIDVPTNAREALLTRLEADLYRDAMALNVNQISGGNITATAINAAYDPQDGNANDFEDKIIDFVDSILVLAGFDTNVKYRFKRSRIANQLEETQMILSAGQYLDQETILRHLPFLSADEIEGVLKRTTREEAARYADADEGEEDVLPTDETETENAPVTDDISEV